MAKKNESLEEMLRKLEEAEKEYSEKLREIDLEEAIRKASAPVSKK